MRQRLLVLALLSTLFAACGSDSDDAFPSSSVVSTAAPTTAGGQTPPTTEAPEVPTLGASGTATFESGDIVLNGDIVECTLAEPEVSFVANGELANIQVFSLGGGEVDVVIAGGVEFEGRGTASISGGDVSITGAGSPSGAGTTTREFSIVAKIGAC
jgi:hypothetical protein